MKLISFKEMNEKLIHRKKEYRKKITKINTSTNEILENY